MSSQIMEEVSDTKSHIQLIPNVNESLKDAKFTSSLVFESSLVKMDQTTNARTKKYNEYLVTAAGKGYTEACQNLIKAGADINYKNKSALIAATLGNHMGTAMILVEAGLNVDFQDSNGNSDLMRAAEEGNTERVKALLMVGSSVNLRSKNGDNALMKACREGHYDIANELVEAWSEINLKNTKGNTALIISCANGRNDTAKLLLQSGAEINETNINGWTALMCACSDAHDEIVKQLLQTGIVDKEAVNKDGKTALDLAT